MLKTGITDHESVPVWEFIYSYFEGGKMFCFYFLMQIFSVTTAVPSEGNLSVIPIALCLSCKPVVKPDITNFLTLTFKGSVSESGRQFVYYLLCVDTIGHFHCIIYFFVRENIRTI